MLTVRDVLKMPVFAEAKLVAGARGLDRLIRWVHIVDVPDARYEWAKGGELLLTAGFGLRDDFEHQKLAIPILATKQLAGMVLSVGHYFDETPALMRDAADRLSFPIIELPPDVPFIDITESIFTQIIDEQYALQTRSEQIHRSLTELVLDGSSFQDVADALTEILDRSITIESIDFEVLAFTEVGAVDDARKRSTTARRSSPQLAKQLIDYGIYDRLLQERRPVYIESLPEIGMDMERIVAPIIVAQSIIGYVWVIIGERELSDLDALAIDHAVTVAALLMFKERAVQDAEMSLRGDFLSQLLENENSGAPTSALIEQARQFKFNLTLSYQVLVIESYLGAGDGQTSLANRLENWCKNHHQALVVARERQVVVILQSHRKLADAAIPHQLFTALNHPGEQLLIGVGKAAENISDLSKSYEQAAEALAIGRTIGQREGVREFDGLGVLHWLYHLPPPLLSENHYLSIIETLATHDSDHQADLLHTLEVFLDKGTIAADAAADLHIHRNTLAYRLESIEKVIGLDLKNPAHRLNLHVALKAYRLG